MTEKKDPVSVQASTVKSRNTKMPPPKKEAEPSLFQKWKVAIISGAIGASSAATIGIFSDSIGTAIQRSIAYVRGDTTVVDLEEKILRLEADLIKSVNEAKDVSGGYIPLPNVSFKECLSITNKEVRARNWAITEVDSDVFELRVTQSTDTIREKKFVLRCVATDWSDTVILFIFSSSVDKELRNQLKQELEIAFEKYSSSAEMLNPKDQRWQSFGPYSVHYQFRVSITRQEFDNWRDGNEVPKAIDGVFLTAGAKKKCTIADEFKMCSYRYPRHAISIVGPIAYEEVNLGFRLQARSDWENLMSRLYEIDGFFGFAVEGQDSEIVVEETEDEVQTQSDGTESLVAEEPEVVVVEVDPNEVITVPVVLYLSYMQYGANGPWDKSAMSFGTEVENLVRTIKGMDRQFDVKWIFWSW